MDNNVSVTMRTETSPHRKISHDRGTSAKRTALEINPNEEIDDLSEASSEADDTVSLTYSISAQATPEPPLPPRSGRNTTRLLTAAALGLGAIGVVLASSSYCPIKATLPQVIGLVVGLEILKLPEDMRDGSYAHLAVWSLRQIGYGAAAVLSSAVLVALSPQAMTIAASASVGILATSFILTRTVGKLNFDRITEFSESSVVKGALVGRSLVESAFIGVYLGARYLKPSQGIASGAAAALLAIRFGQSVATLFLDTGAHLTWPAGEQSFAEHMAAAEAVSQGICNIFSAITCFGESASA